MRNLILLLFVLGFSSVANAQNATPKYYKCNSRISGKWVYGIAPSACTVDPFISKNIVRDKFSLYTFDEKKTDSTERRRYVNELHNLISKTAEYYLKKRDPNVGKTELGWWNRIILTIATHESFLSHYRDGKDSKLRMMRGDFGHGHGLMQVDDRYHFVNINNGTAAQIVKNLFYAMDIYYAGWKASKTASCISSTTNYYNRARAAYAVYNGGAKRVCRWTNPNDTWARNDKNFREALDAKKWERYLSSSHKFEKLDIACLASDKTDCSSQSGGSDDGGDNDSSNPKGKILNYKNFYCALSDDSYFCVSQEKYNVCLISGFDLENTVVKTNVDRPITLLRPSEICPSGDQIFEVGKFIRVEKNINLRATPGGQKVGLLSSGSTFQILGSYVNANAERSRYYLVRANNQFGFFFAGNKQTASSWTSLTSDKSDLILPIKDSVIKIETNSGINLRRTPAGLKVGAAVSRQNYKVLDTVFVGKTNKFYLKINVDGTNGWIYAGQIHPLYSVDNWISVERK